MVTSSLYPNLNIISYLLSEKMEVEFQDLAHSHSISLYIKGSRKKFTMACFYVYRKELETTDIFTNRTFMEEKEAIARTALDYVNSIHKEYKNRELKEVEQQEITTAKEEKESIEKAKNSLRDLLDMSEIPRIKHYDKDGISCRIVANRIGKSVLRSELPTAGSLSEKQIENKPLFINECHKMIESNLGYLRDNQNYLSLESQHVLEETIPHDLNKIIRHQELIRTRKKEALIKDSLYELLLMTNTLRKEIEETQIKELKITNQTIKNRRS